MKYQLGSVFCPPDSSSRRSSRGCCCIEGKGWSPPKELQRKGRESGRARRHRREVDGEGRKEWRLPAWRTFSSSTSRGEARSVFFGKGSEGDRSVCVFACMFFGVFFSSATAMGKEVSAVVNNSFFFPFDVGC